MKEYTEDEVKFMILQLGNTRKEISCILGVSESFVSMVLTGSKPISKGMLKHLELERAEVKFVAMEGDAT